MNRKDIKSRCEKRKIPKCDDVCKTYNEVQFAAADYLAELAEVAEIRVNVHLEGLGLEEEYTSDFVCTKTNGELMVRECVFRKHITKPKTAKLLEASRSYWEKRGCRDWGIMVDAKE